MEAEVLPLPDATVTESLGLCDAVTEMVPVLDGVENFEDDRVPVNEMDLVTVAGDEGLMLLDAEAPGDGEEDFGGEEEGVTLADAPVDLDRVGEGEALGAGGLTLGDRDGDREEEGMGAELPLLEFDNTTV